MGSRDDLVDIFYYVALNFKTIQAFKTVHQVNSCILWRRDFPQVIVHYTLIVYMTYSRHTAVLTSEHFKSL